MVNMSLKRGRRRLGVIVLLAALVATAAQSSIGQTPAAQPAAARSVRLDLSAQPLAMVPPGTRISRKPPKGWTHMILLAVPRIGSGDVAEIDGSLAAKYAAMFKLAILANVEQGDDSRWRIDKVGVGFATNIGGAETVVTSDTAPKLGANLGIIGRAVLDGNEDCLDDVNQVAKSDTMMVFDAKAVMLHGGDHRDMIMRHVILVDPNNGGLGTLVWLLDHDGRGGYTLATREMQFLPANLIEDRVLNVDADKFTLGIPSADAFALVRVPRGTPIPFGAETQRVAAINRFTPDDFGQFESAMWRAIMPPKKE